MNKINRIRRDLWHLDTLYIYTYIHITQLTCELPDELVVKKNSFFHIQIFKGKMEFWKGK